jgi:hypothetical protein
MKEQGNVPETEFMTLLEDLIAARAEEDGHDVATEAGGFGGYDLRGNSWARRKGFILAKE